MPKPPRRTIPFLCCFLFSGLSIKFNLKLNLLTIGIKKYVNDKAKINPIKLFAAVNKM